MSKDRLRRYRKALKEMTVRADCPLSGVVVVPAGVRPREAARMALSSLRPIVLAKVESLRLENGARS